MIFRSPMRIPPRGSYFDEDDDSGADSLDQQLQQACCSRRLYPHQQQSFPVGSPMSSSSSMALVPYEQSVGCCSTPRHHHLGCQHHPYQTDWCCPMGSETMSTSTALQTLPGVEERLLQLEGDKDSLHLQVGFIGTGAHSSQWSRFNMNGCVDVPHGRVTRLLAILGNAPATFLPM